MKIFTLICLSNLIINWFECSCSLIYCFTQPCLDFVDDFKYLTVHCFFDSRANLVLFWVWYDILQQKGSLVRVRHHGGSEVKLKVEVLILVKDKLLGLWGIIRLLVRFWKREIRHWIRWAVWLMPLESRMLNV